MSQFHTFDTTQIWSVLSIFTPHRQNSGIVTCPKRYEFLKFNLLSKMEKNCDFTSKMANFKGPKIFFFIIHLEKKVVHFPTYVEIFHLAQQSGNLRFFLNPHPGPLWIGCVRLMEIVIFPRQLLS